MSVKLYPPQTENTLPAVIKGNQLIVPFQLNRAVSRSNFNCMSIIMKTVQTNTILCNGQKQYSTTSIEYDNNMGYFKAIFPASVSNLMQIGQYYKIQVAFVQRDDTQGEYNIGYYSSASIIKCTAQPNIYIQGLNATQAINTHRYSYTGIYSQDIEGGDRTEKVYSYRFDLYDETEKLIATSGNLIHNSSLDTERYTSSDEWIVTKNLQPGYWYTVQYTVTTLNNLTVASPAYKVMVIENVDFDFPADVSAQMNNVDGYVDISLIAHSNKDTIRGSFILIRGSEEDNYDTWQELYRFDLVNQKPEMRLWQDFTVQQGMHYKYAIQAYNDNNLFSSKIFNIEGPVFADFEDAFLFDGKRQLNIRYNPKVSSFKTVILESKMDTLGGQHPFIFRNGNVHYQEFPISGLISLFSDPNGLFIKNEDDISTYQSQPRDKTKSLKNIHCLDTSLSGDNFRKERQFKMEVLEWLNDGQPKLFRSPGEGNFIVRLMNVSLSPNDTLGRMLHTFSCTAYEIAEYNFNNLNQYGFIKAPQIVHNEMRIGQLSLRSLFNNAEIPLVDTEYTFTPAAYFLSISNQQYDSLVLEFTFLNGTTINQNVSNVTGHFNIPIDESPIVKMKYKSGKISNDSIVTYGYYDTNITNNFSYITNITIEDKIAQYVGGNFNNNLIETIEDIRLQTGRFYYIKATARNIYGLWINNGKYYRDKEFQYEFTNWDTTAIYEIRNGTTWLYGSPSKESKESPDFRFQLNSELYSNLEPMKHGGEYRTQGDLKAITNVDRVERLSFGSGVIIDLVYQLKTFEYSVENTDTAVQNAKNDWINTEKIYNEAVTNEIPEASLIELKTAMDIAYTSYLNTLQSALNREQEIINELQ